MRVCAVVCGCANSFLIFCRVKYFNKNKMGKKIDNPESSAKVSDAEEEEEEYAVEKIIDRRVRKGKVSFPNQTSHYIWS